MKKKYGNSAPGKLIAKLLMLICFAAITACSVVGFNDVVTVENDHFRYEIGRDGRNVRFIDKATGIDYLLADTISYCAYADRDGTRYPVSAAALSADVLKLEFEDINVHADIRIVNERNHIFLEVREVKGQVESLDFLNVPLTLDGMPGEPFAACVLSMNLKTHVRQLPALQSHLSAACYDRFGMKGAKIALLGVPVKEMLPEIREVMKDAKEIPHSEAGGAWSQLSKLGYGSYLMNFGSLNEETVDEWIERCRSVGFNQIDSHGGHDLFKFGSFELDPEKWPDGWEGFKRINKRLHDAGIASILHTYAFFIDKDSKYVSPVPSEDLAYFRTFTLARPVGVDDDEIVVSEPTTDVSAVTGFHVPNSRTLRIGDELIEFSGVTKTAPYKFTGCQRGANGTRAASHGVDTKAYHLKEMFGKFLPGPETPLFSQIAYHTAEIVNECHFDGIYLDAIDGSDILDGPENFWYYGGKFVMEIAKHLKHPVGMEMSSMIHSWWHYRSRWQAWDRPNRGYKRFVDIHSASLKSDELEHGYFRGYGPEIDRLAPLENGGHMLPLHLGWWGHQTWSPPQLQPTFTDDVEYLACKMIGNNAGLSMMSGVDEKTLAEYPVYRRLNAILKQYEKLRHQNYFSDSVRRLLRQPGKEFTLFKQEDGTWNFKPVTYQKHKVTGLDHPSAQWRLRNEFHAQPVRLRIEALMSARPYNDPDNVVLANFASRDEFAQLATADGVSGSIETVSGEGWSGPGDVGVFTASSTGRSPQAGAWISMEKKFDPWLDLGQRQALGVWIKGDGSGALLNLMLDTPHQFSAGVRGDRYVKIDFTGWKYFELVETESERFSDYSWPGAEILSEEMVKDLFVYKSYMHTIQFSKVHKIQLWYNNLPPGKEVKCVLSPVKALTMVPIRIENPSVIIRGEKIVFPVTMTSGMYLEFLSMEDCKLYGPKGELLKEVKPIGKEINLVAGENEIRFSCEGPESVNTRVQVTVISEGRPLGKDNN